MKTWKDGKKTADCISYNKCCTAGETEKNNGRMRTDAEMRNTLKNIGTRIEASDSLKRRIDFQIAESVKEEHKMKHISIKKVILGVTAACVLTGTIAIAGSGIISYSSHGSAVPEYSKFEDMGKAEAEIGYSVDAIENFSNGFVFEGMGIREETLQDETGQVAGQRKSLRIAYSKGGEEIEMYAGKLHPAENTDALMGGEWDKTLQIGDVTVKYVQNTYKAVPPGYELTEEDKKAEESGRLQIGYGSDKVEVNQFSYIRWIKDGIDYELLGFDVSVSADEMLGMAREVIEGN